MSAVQPSLDGVNPVRADAFARWRILGLRGRCCGPDPVVRVTLVCCADINSPDHLADNAAWWDSSASAGAQVDLGTRIDIALGLYDGVSPRPEEEGTPVIATWERHGPNDLLQSDVDWLAAIRHAAAARGCPPPPLLVLSRWGWRCLPAGTSRTWKRVRTTAPAGPSRQSDASY